MADLSDVANGLAALIGATLYPNGTAQASLTGDAAKVFQGWPDAEQLKADMNAQGGPVSVSIFPTKIEKVLPLTFLRWIEEGIEPPTISLTLAAQTLLIAGSMPAPFSPVNLAVIANGLSFVYSVKPTDTLPLIAAGLQALLSVAIPGTTAIGALIFLPASARLTAARVGTVAHLALPVRRQQRVFQITVWANASSVRDRVGSAIDVALASTYRLPLPDGSTANLAYSNSTQDDSLMRQTTYRRDLFYSVDFQTIRFADQATIVTTQITESATIIGSTITNPAVTINS